MMMLQQVMPYVGMLFLLLSLIFAIISAVDVKTPDKLDFTTDPKAANTYFMAYKMNNLALTFAVIGGALLVACYKA